MLAEVQSSQTCEMWRGCLKGVQRNVEVWQALLSVFHYHFYGVFAILTIFMEPPS